MEEISRCTGHCCRDFSLPSSPEDLQKLFKEKYIEHKKHFQRIKDSSKRFAKTIKYLKSDVFIVPQMVIPLASIEVDLNGELIPYTMHHYTCKYHDLKTGDCTIYEYRPRMCSGFPEYSPNGKCPYKACTRKIKENVALIENELGKDSSQIKEEVLCET